MKTCGNCGNVIVGEGFRYAADFEVCRPCEDKFRDEQAAHEAAIELTADALHEDRFEVAYEPEESFEELDPAYMGGLDSDLLGEN
jgi:hypothetical protein